MEPIDSPERASQGLKELSNKLMFTRTISHPFRNADTAAVIVAALLVVMVVRVAIVAIQIVRFIMKLQK